MKAITSKLLPLIMSLLFMPLASCGGSASDDDDLKGDKQLLLGGWEISNLPDVAVFMKNNKVLYNGKLYTWNYNPSTMMLATDIKIPQDEWLTYQWTLTMITEESWTGFRVNKSGTQLNARASRDVLEAVKAILSIGSWMTRNEDELKLDSYTVSNYDLTESKDRNSIEMKKENGRITYTMVNPYDYDKVYVKDSTGKKYYLNMYEKY